MTLEQLQADNVLVAKRLVEREADVERLQAEIERLRELLRKEGANRYWEGRWRDEHAENERLRAELAITVKCNDDCHAENARCAMK